MDEPKPRTRLYHDAALAKGAHVVLDKDQAHYLQHVLRQKQGDALRLFNERDGEWLATITEIKKKSAALAVSEQLAAPTPLPDVWVLFAPIKFGKIDFLAQKITELGAAKMQPVITEYTQMQRVNYERLRANAIEAAQQCERTSLPEVAESVNLRQLLADWPEDRLLVYGDESGDGVSLGELCAAEKPEKWGLLIGPEGGFSPQEHALLKAHKNIKAVGLGPRILRADTAALTLLAVTQSHWGDWSLPPHFESPAHDDPSD